ncbi:MAG: lipoprotein [Gammaproteobacteria bacterium]|nr:lipoprotein [Gammaproteobacteria bacterium]
MRKRGLECILWIVLALFGLGGLLSGCGQKGDLYLPQKNPPQQQQQH